MYFIKLLYFNQVVRTRKLAIIPYSVAILVSHGPVVNFYTVASFQWRLKTFLPCVDMLPTYRRMVTLPYVKSRSQVKRSNCQFQIHICLQKMLTKMRLRNLNKNDCIFENYDSHTA